MPSVGTERDAPDGVGVAGEGERLLLGRHHMPDLQHPVLPTGSEARSVWIERHIGNQAGVAGQSEFFLVGRPVPYLHGSPCRGREPSAIGAEEHPDDLAGIVFAAR